MKLKISPLFPCSDLYMNPFYLTVLGTMFTNEKVEKQISYQFPESCFNNKK